MLPAGGAMSAASTGRLRSSWALRLSRGQRSDSRRHSPTSRASPSGSDRGSAQRYVWHVVDALRSGTERLRTLALDPDAGGVPWDADLAMAVRARSPPSVRVGLRELLATARPWERAAVEAPGDVTTDHPGFGAMDRLLMVRRTAHEVVHHAFVIGRLVAQTESPAPVEPRQ